MRLLELFLLACLLQVKVDGVSIVRFAGICLYTSQRRLGDLNTVTRIRFPVRPLHLTMVTLDLVNCIHHLLTSNMLTFF